MKEEWRSVVGYEGHYEVSNLGRVRSLKYGKIRMRKLAIGGPRCNYHRLDLYKDGKCRMKVVGQLVLEAFVGHRPKNYFMCHGPEGSLNDSLSNLTWGSPSKNANEDRIRDGTDGKGERNPSAKVTKKDIFKIRRDNRTLHEIEKDYSIKKSQISNIKRKISWAHV